MQLSYEEKEQLTSTERERVGIGHDYCAHGFRLSEPDNLEFRISLRCPQCCPLPHPACPEGQHGNYLAHGYHNIILAQIHRYANLWREDATEFDRIVRACREHLQKKSARLTEVAAAAGWESGKMRAYIKTTIKNFLADLWRAAEAEGPKAPPYKWLLDHLRRDRELQRIWREELSESERTAFILRHVSALATLSGRDEATWELIAWDMRERGLRCKSEKTAVALLYIASSYLSFGCGPPFLSPAVPRLSVCCWFSLAGCAVP